MLNIGENRQVFIQIKYKKELKFFHLKIYGTNLVPKKFHLTLIEGNTLPKQINSGEKYSISNGRRLIIVDSVKKDRKNNRINLSFFQHRSNHFEIKQSINFSDKEYTALLIFVHSHTIPDLEIHLPLENEYESI